MTDNDNTLLLFWTQLRYAVTSSLFLFSITITPTLPKTFFSCCKIDRSNLFIGLHCLQTCYHGYSPRICHKTYFCQRQRA